MFRIIPVLLPGVLLCGMTVAAQNRPADTNPPYPIFSITTVGRTIPAVNFHHRQGATNVGFLGTGLAPKAKGEVKVESKTGATKLDARFDSLPPAQTLGGEFLTYVLWAITPEGRFENLGEVYADYNHPRLQAATELQSFGMIVTAEPYYAVTQPSNVVVLENVPVSTRMLGTTTGTISNIEAKYELLERGAYDTLLPQAERNLTRGDRKDSPLDLKEARHAMVIARTLGADVYAIDTMRKADIELKNAEDFWRNARDKKKVQTLARNATQHAEDARLITVRRRADLQLQAEREEAAAKARMEEERRIDAERIARETRAQADRAALEAQAEAERRRVAEEQALAARSRELQLTEQQASLKAERDRLERERQELRRTLREQLNLIMETRDTARGLIVNISDVNFETGRWDLKPGAREKLAKVSGIILSHPGLNLKLEGHTDSVGSDDFNQRLSEKRAFSVRDYLVSQGMNGNTVEARGFGETMPVASNDTAAGRLRNRRVELIVTGDIIDRRDVPSS